MLCLQEPWLFNGGAAGRVCEVRAEVGKADGTPSNHKHVPIPTRCLPTHHPPFRCATDSPALSSAMCLQSGGIVQAIDASSSDNASSMLNPNDYATLAGAVAFSC